MNILILGSGGREHAIAWKIKQSQACDNLYIAPGNAGTAQIGKNIDIAYNDFSAVKESIITFKIDLVFVGPEEPLVNGIVDYLKRQTELVNVLIIGPDQKGAQLEGSKAWAKEFMIEFNIPTANYAEFDDENKEDGLDYLGKCTTPIVLKADGLAAGKGVVITDNRIEAKEVFISMLGGMFGQAGKKIVIEDFLTGVEFSVFVLTDGKDYVILPEAKDYKRIGENDTGPNTGGMGAISPVPFYTNDMREKVINRIIEPTIKGLQKKRIDYCGIIFLGLINVNGDPYVIEYNCRMGDPETEVVMPRIKSDFVTLLVKAAKKKMEGANIKLHNDVVATIMLVSGGYPGDYQKEKLISCTEEISESIVFHAGTLLKQNQFLSNGGRVIALTSIGKTIEEAVNKSLKSAETIQFEGKNYRKDIGKDLMNWQSKQN
ncbi:MAG TPA: phosphoribosylamine--glycine ligase [Saprospiraceae bacterium]|nr:phosphoribosylamine--glycine ligase [Saprospiraceae bacterium]